MVLQINLVVQSYYIVTFIIAGIGWIILFSGTAAFSALIDSLGASARQSGASIIIVVMWLHVIYQLALIFSLFMFIVNDTLKHYRFALLSFLIISFIANASFSIVFSIFDWSQAKAVLAGSIFLLIVNFFWIILIGSEEDSFVVKTVAQSYNNINFGAIDQSFNSISNHFSSQPRPMHPTSDIRHTSLSVVMSPTETSSPIQANNTIYIGQSQMQDQHSNVILPSTSTQPQQVSYFGKVPVQDQRTNSIPSLHQSIYQNNQSTNMVVDDYKFKAKALYDYHGSPEDNSELSFNKDEYLDIASKEGKWWRARKSDGTTGIAPSNYLQLIP